MKIKEEVFLSGWGFLAAVWQYFDPNISASHCIDLPDFSHANEALILQEMTQKLTSASTIHAWSHSGIWLLKLLQGKCISPENVYLYAPPLAWQFKSEAKKQAFVNQYEANKEALANKFLKLIHFPCAPKLTTIERYCVLTRKTHYQSELNYLKWMLAFSLDIDDVVNVLKGVDWQILLARHDAIVDNETIQQKLNTSTVSAKSHIDLLHYRRGVNPAC